MRKSPITKVVNGHFGNSDNMYHAIYDTYGVLSHPTNDRYDVVTFDEKKINGFKKYWLPRALQKK